MSDARRRARGAPRGRAAWAVLAAALAALPGASGATTPVPGADPAPEALLRAADAPRRVIEEGAIQVRATVEEPGAGPVVSDLEVFVRGEDQVLCVFRSGPFAGRRILSVGSKVWLLFPDTTRPVPVSASQRLLGGASIADVARLRFAADFEATLRPEREEAGGASCYVLDLKARDRKVPYASGVLWVGAADRLPRRAVFRLRSGIDAKEVRFQRYERTARGSALRREEIVHLLPNERGMKTILEYLGAEARTLDAALFTPEHADDPL